MAPYETVFLNSFLSAKKTHGIRFFGDMICYALLNRPRSFGTMISNRAQPPISAITLPAVFIRAGRSG